MKGRLVVDGDNIKHKLNSQDWSHGGQFYQYGGSVRAFYSNLKRSGVIPVVVLDGIDHTGEKWATILKRRKERLRVMYKSLTKENRESEMRGNNVYPSLSSDVYTQVLADLHIEYVVVDGEADGVIVAMANYYNCPVLSSDSDFYMYTLTGGFLPMERFQKDSNPITAELFRYEDFCAQFRFQDESTRFIIPSLVGNDTISAVLHDRTADFKTFIEEEVARGENEVPEHPLGVVVLYAAFFESLDAFLVNISRLRHLSRGSQAKLKDNCQKSREMYNCMDTFCINDIREEASVCASNGHPIPSWIVKNYRKGRFSVFLFSMMVINRHILGTFVDDVAKESSTTISLPIRKCIYGIIGQDSQYEEHYRAMGEPRLTSEHIEPSVSINGRPLPQVEKISTLSHPKRENLFLSILHCDGSSLSGVEEGLQLPMAATMYWSRQAQPPPHLVKSLLLCFVMCFRHSKVLKKHFKNSEKFRLSPEWTNNLHYFAQWQSCYKDCISLNQLLKLPLYISSPAFLYDGKLVMHLAEPPNLDLGSLVADDVQLYHRLLSVVLPGEVVEGAVGGSQHPSGALHPQRRSSVSRGRRHGRGPPHRLSSSSGQPSGQSVESVRSNDREAVKSVSATSTSSEFIDHHPPHGFAEGSDIREPCQLAPHGRGQFHGTSQGSKSTISGIQSARGGPQSSSSRSQSARGQTQSKRSASQFARGGSQSARGKPQSARGGPPSAIAGFQSVRGGPQSARGDRRPLHTPGQIFEGIGGDQALSSSTQQQVLRASQALADHQKPSERKTSLLYPHEQSARGHNSRGGSTRGAGTSRGTPSRRHYRSSRRSLAASSGREKSS